MSENGRVPLNTLVAISGTYLRPVTAEAFVNMARACGRETGVLLDIVNGGGGYRDIDAQWVVYRNPPKGVSVAYPGHSTHGQGYALDLTTTCFTREVAAWVRAHCREYGFAVPPANDPRHLYHNGSTTGPAESAKPDPEKDEEMTTYELITEKTGATIWFSVNRMQRYPLPSTAVVKDYQFWMQNELGITDTAVKVVASLASFGVEVGAPSKAPEINYDELAKRLPAPLTTEQIAAEVIRQMKLPGN